MTVTFCRRGGHTITLRLLCALWCAGRTWTAQYRQPLPCGGYLMRRIDLSDVSVSVEV